MLPGGNLHKGVGRDEVFSLGSGEMERPAEGSIAEGFPSLGSDLSPRGPDRAGPLPRGLGETKTPLTGSAKVGPCSRGRDWSAKAGPISQGSGWVRGLCLILGWVSI
jgi:hypothetical protein